MGNASVKPASQLYNILEKEGLRVTGQYQISIIGAPIAESILKEINNLTFFATGSELPSRTQNFAQMYYLGYEFQQATNMTWSNELTMTINCDAFLKLRDALLFWEGITTNPYIKNGAKGDGIKTASPAMVLIDLFDQTMTQCVETYVLYGAVPSNIGTMTLSNNGDGIAMFDCGFKYQFWSALPGGSISRN